MVFSFGKSKGGGVDVGASKDLMNYQSNLWRGDTEWLNTQGWKQLRQGLINADYNPLLAIGVGPSSGPMTSAVASEGTVSSNFSADLVGAGNASGSTAQGKATIGNIQANTAQQTANATKLMEEAKTQGTIRSLNESQTNLNNVMKLLNEMDLPYREKKNIMELMLTNSIIGMNNATTASIPQNVESNRITANAAQTNAETNKSWTPAKVVGGIGAGLLGAVGIGKIGQVAKGAKWFKYGGKHVNDWKTIYNGL